MPPTQFAQGLKFRPLHRLGPVVPLDPVEGLQALALGEGVAETQGVPPPDAVDGTGGPLVLARVLPLDESPEGLCHGKDANLEPWKLDAVNGTFGVPCTADPVVPCRDGDHPAADGEKLVSGSTGHGVGLGLGCGLEEEALQKPAVQQASKGVCRGGGARQSGESHGRREAV